MGTDQNHSTWEIIPLTRLRVGSVHDRDSLPLEEVDAHRVARHFGSLENLHDPTANAPAVGSAPNECPASESVTWIQLVTSYPARMAGYGLITMLAFQFVYASIQSHGVAWLAAENGPLELSQVALLLMASAGITVAACWMPVGRSGLLAAAAVTLYAAARESDDWIEAAFFDDAYKWLVGLPAAAAVGVVAYRERGKLIEETLRITQKPSVTLLIIGGIYLCFFCQMMDRPLFWSGSGLEGNLGFQKTTVEESAELFAYLLIAFSSVEAVISAARDRTATKSQSGVVGWVEERQRR